MRGFCRGLQPRYGTAGFVRFGTKTRNWPACGPATDANPDAGEWRIPAGARGRRSGTAVRSAIEREVAHQRMRGNPRAKQRLRLLKPKPHTYAPKSSEQTASRAARMLPAQCCFAASPHSSACVPRLTIEKMGLPVRSSASSYLSCNPCEIRSLQNPCVVMGARKGGGASGVRNVAEGLGFSV